MALTVCFHPMSHGLPFICIHWTLWLARFFVLCCLGGIITAWCCSAFCYADMFLMYFISIGLVSGWRFVSCTGFTGLMDIMFRSRQ